MIDDQYECLLEDVLLHGEPRHDRTGIGTRSVFGRQLRYDLSKGFPRITTKFVPMKPIRAELLWQIEGSTSEPRLRELGAGWWAPWADQDGDLFDRLTYHEINAWAIKENKPPSRSADPPVYEPPPAASQRQGAVRARDR